MESQASKCRVVSPRMHDAVTKRKYRNPERRPLRWTGMATDGAFDCSSRRIGAYATRCRTRRWNPRAHPSGFEASPGGQEHMLLRDLAYA